MRKVIFVLGMHRSGTSFLAQMMGRLGGVLPSTMGSAGEDNLDGYFEPENLVNLHDEIFSQLNMSWMSINEAPKKWFRTKEALRYKEKLLAAFEVAYGDQEFVVFKDPRVCKLLPLWLSIIESNNWEACFVLTVRNSSEVASSLFKRNGIEHSYSEALWLSYNQCLESYLSKEKKITLEFPSWVESDNSALYETLNTFAPEFLTVSEDEFKQQVNDTFKSKYINNSVDVQDSAVQRDAFHTYHKHLISSNFSDMRKSNKLKHDCKAMLLEKIAEGYMNLLWELSDILVVSKGGQRLLSASHLLDILKTKLLQVDEASLAMEELERLIAAVKNYQIHSSELLTQTSLSEKQYLDMKEKRNGQ